MNQKTDNRIPNILYVFKLPPPVNGATISNQQIKDSELLNSSYRSFYINYGLSRGSDDFGTIRIQKVWFYFRSIFLIFRYLLFYRINIVYITISPKGFSFFKDSLFVLITKLLFKKAIVHLHGKGIGKAVNKTWVHLIYYKWVFYGVRVICLSDSLLKDIKEVYKGKPFIVPNGIPEVNYSKIDIVKSETPVLVFLSNLYIRKGVLNLLSSIEKLKQINQNFHTWIIGNSTGDFSIEDLNMLISEKGLEDNISVLGPQYGDDKYKLLKSASLFIFPTEWPNEAFPIVLLEALQAGLPVVASQEGGIPDIIEDGVNGYVVGATDYSKISEKVNKILTDKDLYNKMSENNIIKYKELYTLSNFENNLHSVFREVI